MKGEKNIESVFINVVKKKKKILNMLALFGN